MLTLSSSLKLVKVVEDTIPPNERQNGLKMSPTIHLTQKKRKFRVIDCGESGDHRRGPATPPFLYWQNPPSLAD